MQGLNPVHSDEDALEAYTGQPGLFSGLDLNRPLVLAARRHLHTGTTTTSHEEQAAQIVALATLNWSDSRIAAHLGHSRSTVSAVLRLAEKAEKVEQVQARVLSAAAQAIHSDIELGVTLADEIRAGDRTLLRETAAFKTATWVGVRQLAGTVQSAPPPSVSVTVGAGSVVQVVENYRRRIAGLASPDSESGADKIEHQQNEGNAVAVMPAVIPGPSDSHRSAGERAGASEGRGGGCELPGGAGDTDGKG